MMIKKKKIFLLMTDFYNFVIKLDNILFYKSKVSIFTKTNS